MTSFEELMDKSEIITLDREIVSKASEIYAELKRRGELIEDADILIAASCLVKRMVLVTDVCIIGLGYVGLPLAKVFVMKNRSMESVLISVLKKEIP